LSERPPSAGTGGPHTLHMLPADRWAAWRDGPVGARYEPEGFAADGFVRCTDGAEQMGADVPPRGRYHRWSRRQQAMTE